MPIRAVSIGRRIVLTHLSITLPWVVVSTHPDEPETPRRIGAEITSRYTLPPWKRGKKRNVAFVAQRSDVSLGPETYIDVHFIYVQTMLGLTTPHPFVSP